MKRYKTPMVHRKIGAYMEKPFSTWKESSSGLVNESQVINSSSSITPTDPDVTAMTSSPITFRTECPVVLRSRKDIFEGALEASISRNRAALDELAKY